MRLLSSMAVLFLVAAAPPAVEPPPVRPEPRQAPILPPPGGPVVAVAISPDGKWVLTGNYICYASLWRTDREAPLWTVPATKGEPKDQRDGGLAYGALAVGFAADGKRVFCAWKTGIAEISRETGKVLRSHTFPKPPQAAFHSIHWPGAVVFLPGTDECVFHDVDERLVRFNFATGKRHPKFDLKLTEIGMLRVALSPDAKRLLAYSGHYLSEWDLETGEPCRLFGSLPREGFLDAGYCGGNCIWVSRWQLRDGEVRFFRDRTTGEEVDTPDELTKYRGPLWFSPDGKHAFGLPWYMKKEDREKGKEDRVDVLNAKDGKRLREFSSEGVWYRQKNLWRDPKDTTWTPEQGLAAFSPDGKTILLTGGFFKTEMGLWDLTTGKRLQTFRNEFPWK